MANDLMLPIVREMETRLPAFRQVLSATGVPAERLMRTVLISVERMPKLLECPLQTIANSAMTAAVLGLEVDGITGQGFLIPYRDRGSPVCQFQIGYKGYNTIAARSSTSISSGVAREGDRFDFQLGSGAYVRYRPAPEGRAGRRIEWAWAVAEAEGRPPVVVVIPYADVLAIKAKSPGARRSESPWNDIEGRGHEAMCAKTAVRRIGGSLPIIGFQRATALDGVQEAGKAAWLREDGNLIIDGETADGRQTYPDRAAPITDLDIEAERRKPAQIHSQQPRKASEVLAELKKMDSEQGRRWLEENRQRIAEMKERAPEVYERFMEVLATLPPPADMGGEPDYGDAP